MKFAGELLARKIIETLLALTALVLLSFVFLRLLPGGPFDGDFPTNEAVQASLKNLWALDRSWFFQLTHYFSQLLHGNLGISMAHVDTPVVELIARGFHQTLLLNTLAVLLSFGMAFVTAGLAALFRHSWFDLVAQAACVVGISLPALFLGPVLIYVFGFYWQLLPTAFLTSPAHYVLPVMTLSLRPWAQLHLLLGTNLQETLHLDFIRTAKAKGLSRARILVRHAFRNSLLPLLAMSGPLIAGLISGSFLVEILFSVHGLGQQFADSLNQRDYPVIMGLVLTYGFVLIILTNIFETIATWVDPRTRGLS